MHTKTIQLIQQIQMSKARVNMKLDSDNWVKLQNLAAIQNSSCTAIIDQLIDAYVNEKLPDNYEQRIQEQVYNTLDTAISDNSLRRISELVNTYRKNK